MLAGWPKAVTSAKIKIWRDCLVSSRCVTCACTHMVKVKVKVPKVLVMMSDDLSPQVSMKAKPNQSLEHMCYMLRKVCISIDAC